jgi:hypothetical protein
MRLLLKVERTLGNVLYGDCMDPVPVLSSPTCWLKIVFMLNKSINLESHNIVFGTFSTINKTNVVANLQHTMDVRHFGNHKRNKSEVK